MRFSVDAKVFQRFENLFFGVVVAKGIDNTEGNTYIKELLQNSIKKVREEFKGMNIKEHPKILPYRNAFI